MVATLGDTRLEPELDELLWGTVNLFHRALARTERQLDANEQAQRRLQREQDGSEVKSLELERLLAEGQSMLERRAALELFRDLAAEGFEHHLAKPWHPRSGSRVSHRNLTAAMIDSRDFLAARRRAEAQLLLPEGPKVAVTGGADFNDHHLIWARLDRVYAKHPDMVLLHGGSPKGTEIIASRWADHRKVPQVAFRPDWAKHGRSAPFKRNDAMLDIQPIGVLVFPGTGIQEIGQHICVRRPRHVDIACVTGRMGGRVAKMYRCTCRDAFVEEKVHARLRGCLPGTATSYGASPFRMGARVDVGRDKGFPWDFRVVFQQIIDRIAVRQPPAYRNRSCALLAKNCLAALSDRSGH